MTVNFYDIIRDRKLSLNSAFFLVYLRGLACSFGVEFKWADTAIIKHLNISRWTLNRLKEDLKLKGLLRYENYGSRHYPTKYTMVDTVMADISTVRKMTSKDFTVANSQSTVAESHNTVAKPHSTISKVISKVINKEMIHTVRKAYASLKELDIKHFSREEYGRTGKAIKVLLTNSDVGQVVAGLEWVAGKGYCDWTIETLIKKWADFMKVYAQPAFMQKWGR